MSQACGKIPSEDDVKSIRESILNPDLTISDSPDPFKDEVTSRKNDHDWWTSKGNHIVAFEDSKGQINLDIVQGPDRGTHRFYDPNTHREGQTGVEDRKTGERRHDKG